MRLEAVPAETWDRFAESARVPLFSRSIWGEVCREGFGADTRYLLLRNEDLSACAGIAGIVLSILGVRLFQSAFPYGGPVGDSHLFAELIRRSEKALKAQGIHSVRIALPPGADSTYPGHRITRLFHHSLPLRGNNMIDQYRSHTRRDVRRALRSGAQVKPLTGPDGVNEFYRLYLQSMEMNRAPAKLPLSLFRAIESRLAPSRQAAFFATRVEGRAVSAICLVYTGGVAHALSQGSDSTYRSHRPTDLLIHTCLEDAARRGMESFDFMASPPDDEPLQRYKEKWGARSGSVLTLDRSLHPVIGTALEVARKLIQLPPLARLSRAVHRRELG
ncbi:MAG: GNAT family N-acetyltransferase [Planctomycetota bacterium]|nr:GNAT family N-acetyltransferase [Planctomycetota bacterium]